MQLSYKEEEIIESTAAVDQLSMLTKQFESFIENHAVQLQEIKALQDGEAIANLREIVSMTLGDCDPVSLVGGMLNLNADEYHSYLESKSSKINLDLSTTLVEKNKEMYQNSLQDLLQDTRLSSNLGKYELKIDSLDYDVGLASAYEVSLQHENSMHPEITLHSNGLKQNVAEDVIGIEDYAQDVKPYYFKLDNHNLTNDLSTEYVKTMNDEYIPNHHKPCLDKLQDYLGGIS